MRFLQEADGAKGIADAAAELLEVTLTWIKTAIRFLWAAVLSVILAAVLVYHPFCDYALKNTAITLPNAVLTVIACLLCVLGFSLRRICVHSFGVSQGMSDKAFVTNWDVAMVNAAAIAACSLSLMFPGILAVLLSHNRKRGS